MLRLVDVSRVLVIVIAVFSAIPGYGQKDNAMARAQFIIRQLNAEKAALNTEKVKLAKELEEAKASLDALKKKSEKKEQRLESQLTDMVRQSEADTKRYADALMRVKESNRKLRTHLAKTREGLTASDQESTQLKQSVAQFETDLTQCIDNNKKIHQLSVDMVNEGLWKPAKSTEPFIQLKRVKIENLAQDYEYKSRDFLISK